MAKFVNDLQREAVQLSFGLDWSIIPVSGKKGVGKWKEAQSRILPPKELRRGFESRIATGVAVVMGAVSGGLVCRDFDTKASYRAWKRQFPKLAERLPTVKTHKGYHVYFNGPDGFEKYEDGEYRGTSGQITVLPPSQHPEGGRYEWVKRPDGPIPKLADPTKVGLRRAKKTSTDREQRSEQSQQKSCYVLLSCSLSEFLTHTKADAEAVEAAIMATVPTVTGKRNEQVFKLCRCLKAFPELKNLPAERLRPVVREWHRLALPVITTKEFADTWDDFYRAWDKVKYPEGEGKIDLLYRRAVRAVERRPHPKLVELYGEKSSLLRLAALCRDLQKEAKDEDFRLDCRTASRLLGIDRTRAASWLRTLCHDKVLTLKTKGTPGTASRYRYTFGG